MEFLYICNNLSNLFLEQARLQHQTVYSAKNELKYFTEYEERRVLLLGISKLGMIQCVNNGVNNFGNRNSEVDIENQV